MHIHAYLKQNIMEIICQEFYLSFTEQLEEQV